MVELKDPPFFVIGAARSGTTLLRLMLGHHSKICRCEEMDFVTPFLKRSRRPVDVKKYHEYLKAHRGFRLSGYSVDRSLDFDALVQSFFVQRQEVDRAELVGAAVHHAVDQIPLIWPNAKLIHLVRDPRDVARSSVAMGWCGTAWNGAVPWIDVHDGWVRLRESMPFGSLLEVRFESLIANVEWELSRICEFLGVDFEPTMTGIDKDTTYSKPNPAIANSWRDSAPPRDVAEIEARIGPQRLAQAGYTPSGVPTLRLHALRRFEIWLRDLVCRLRFRVRRYGFYLWFRGAISRRMPVPAWRRAVQLEIDAVDNAHMK